MTTMVTAQWFKAHRIQLKLLRVSPYVWFIAFFFFYVFILRSLVGLHKQATIDQFNQLPQLPEAQRVEYDTLLKEDHFNVYGRYATNQSLKATLTYFRTQFSQLGWQFGGDNYTFSATSMFYCKDDYTVSVYFSNVNVYAWNYEIWLTWGNSDPCPTTRGGARVLLELVPLLFLFGGSISWASYAFVIGRATWTMKKTEFEFAMREIVNKPSVGKAQAESLGILFLSILAFLLSIYGILSLNW